MEGERYTVELDLKRVGDFRMGEITGKIEKAEKATTKLRKGWDGFTGAAAPFGQAIDSISSKVWGLTKAGVFVGGAAIFSGAVYGVATLNSELEKTQISLGTIFSANGMASSVPVGIEKSKSLIAAMRVDAQKLPGEFDDLMRIYTTGAIPAFRAGATINQFREISAKAMAAGAVSQMDQHQVAREFAQLIEGRAGSHNVFGMKLLGLSGDSATKYNAKTGRERLSIVSKELDKYTGAIDAFGGTFDAQSSTLIDNLKNVGRTATSSLFIHVKESMSEVNSWFSNHQAEALGYSVKIGSAFTGAFESGKRFALEWGPRIYNFAAKAYERFVSIWQDAGPYVDRFGTAVKAALEDPNGTIDKLITLAKLWATLRIGGGFVGGALSGGASGFASKGGMALAGYAMSDAAVNGSSFSSGFQTSLGGAGAGMAFGPYGALAGAAGGAIVSYLQSSAELAATETKVRAQITADAEATSDRMRRLYSLQKGGAQDYENAMEQIRKSASEAAFKVDDASGLLVDSLYSAATAVSSAVESFAFLNHMDRVTDAISSRASSDYGLATAASAIRKLDAATMGGDVNNSKDADKHKHKGGGGGTIQKVEIVVTSNQDPSRIARAVVGHIGKLQRNPGRSPDVRGYDSLEDL